ncbi:MAG: putative metal cation transporter, partial [Thermoleophilia bacterium]|nr:putative metal cation transporter [Thermoleophilia bacterium]
LLPLLVLAAILTVVGANGDRILDGFGHNPPPADELVSGGVRFVPGGVEVRVTNPQAEPITPALVTVDSAYVNSFEVRGGAREIEPRGTRTLTFDYGWIADDPYVITVLSSSGVQTVIDVPAAVPAEAVSSRGLGWGALVGVLVGFVPVALGLVWLPALRRLSAAALAGFLAFTAGLLGFLAVEAASEAFDTQAGLIPAVGGAGVVLMGIVVSMVALALVGRMLRSGARAAAARTGAGALSGGTLALLVAIGIGLHNLGEGLAIGSSFATGEASLAIALIIGFMVHNLTEGVGIAAPIARGGGRLTPLRGLALAALAGLPAVLGIWAGRYVAGQLFTTLCFAIAAGAALQVVVEIVRSLRGGSTGLGSAWVQGGFAAGVLVMWATGILAG